MLNFSGIYKARDKEVDLSLGQTLEEDHFVHNSKVSFLLSKNISTSIELMNIFNKNYSDFTGAIMPEKMANLLASNVKLIYEKNLYSNFISTNISSPKL